QHWIERGRNKLSLGDTAIDANIIPLRVFQRQDLTRRRRKVALGRFRVKPGFDGMAAGPDVVLLEGKWMSGRNGELLCDQVQSGRHLRDGMFDLQPRVHLEEIELASPVD